MKNRITQKNVAMAAAVLACMSFASATFAQQADRTQEKIRLMVAAITHNDNGDYAAAKKSLEELLKIAPDDQRVQQLLAKANADLEASQNSAAVAAPAEEAPAPVESAAAEAVSDVEGDAAEETVAEAAAPADAENAEAAMEEAIRKQSLSIAAAQDLISQAYDAQDNGRYDDALYLLDQADAKLPQARTADKVRARIKEARADIAYERTNKALAENRIPEAKVYVEDYARNEENVAKGDKLREKVAKYDADPYNHTLEDVSPQYVLRQKKISEYLEQGRIQYLYGDYQGAIQSYRSIVAIDSDNIEAKAYLSLIYEKLEKSGARTYKETRSGLLDEVDRAWQRPQVFTRGTMGPNAGPTDSPVKAKLSEIVLPEVSFPEPGVSLVDALNTLSELSMIHDKSTGGSKGVNIIPRMGDAPSKNVSLTVRNLTLEQILGFVTKQANFQYDIEDGAVIVSPARVETSFETYNFPLSPSALVRIRGPKLSDSGSSSNDPFVFDAPSSSGGGSDDEDAQKIKAFLERAGVDFGPGASLAYDGSMVWVTNSLRNIEKVRHILLRYKDVLQVEIEAKFMEVNQGTLRELNFNWNINNGAGNTLFSTFNRSTEGVIMNNRTLASTFSPSRTSQPITITTSSGFTDPTDASQTINQVIPSLPSTINLAQQATDTVSTVLGIINGYNIDFLVQALEQRTGSDLLSSPKVTVMNGVTATITVAQEMLYPTTWGDTQSNVGSSGGGGSGGYGNSSAGVTITPGTPQDFTKREVGVTMEVTPTVDESDSSITLDLAPRVTEFEGFMEYGGVAIAISSGTTVTVPSGFVQPVFAVREIKTQVTIFDGATVVLGGLTREEVKTVNDQVPILGDIPVIGRLFQSKGETRQKRNLLIFVTANRISPGGSLSSEQVGDVAPGSMFQNPTIISPSGTLQRAPEMSGEE